MRAPQAPRRHIRQLVRVSVVALLAGLLHVVASAPSQATNPTYNVEVVTSSEPGTLYVGGWAFDPDAPAVALEINVYIGPNNDDGHSFLADGYRPDVHQHHGVGEYHGIDETLTVRPDLSGPQQVWIVAHNAGTGEGPITIWHGYVTIANSSPVGSFDAISSSQHRQISVSGWAGDPNNRQAPLEVWVYVGGTYDNPNAEKHVISTGVARPDVATATGYGPNAGFAATFTTSKIGRQGVHVYVINHPGSPGGNAYLGARTVDVYVDTTPPQTTITSAPKTATPRDVVHVTFTANEPNATFACRWDEQPWFACQDGTKVSLTPGNHMVWVRATDQYGNTDPEPATWVVYVSADATPTPPPPGETKRTVAARAVKKKSRLRIDVDPDSASTNYRVVIQRKVGTRWRKVVRVRTRGSRDVVVVNLRRGKYRVVLPKSAQGPAVRSSAVRLKR
jgi:hypothetical protein